ncbi:HipA family kinase [Bacillus sp. B15-48]|uniref:HipA family kinase n=1 Tax=Bacillus sp. B15-48 TaxID=1548601 RepID=UPI00193F213E|nr:HipA family kinase [Bacillus sp. B15-48]MBM4762959.1 hypothetical protein [Bacillus sp. B15-48]
MIKPVSYHKKLEGKSNAHLITFNDGNDYVVKFFQSGFEKTLPNEWIGYCLARYLQLPVPYGRIVDIENDFRLEMMKKEQENTKPNDERNEQEDISSNGLLSPQEERKVATQTLSSDTRYQFASLYVPNCEDGHHVGKIHSLSNSSMMARIILFDYWLANRDRTRKNILFQQQEEGVYTLWAIDQAEILGSFNWEQADLEKLPNGIIKSAAHKMMARFIENENEFYQQLEFIQTMPILLIEEIVDMIPDEWGVSKEEKKAIVTTLLFRRDKVLPKLIRRFIQKVYQFMKKDN